MEDRFFLGGNLLCLDFVNTEVMASEGRRDLLQRYEDVAAWLQAAGAVTEAEAHDAATWWGQTEAGTVALERARAFRALLREMAERLAAGEPVPVEVVAAVNALLARPIRVASIRATDGGFADEDGWAFREPDDLLVPVAESARDLLCHRDPSLVRKCRNPDCILFFYDTTKNRGRAWCSMAACGNRTKVAAHYRRRRERST
jgi:predicted RNA-binding Zn ribbon-like protein